MARSLYICLCVLMLSGLAGRTVEIEKLNKEPHIVVAEASSAKVMTTRGAKPVFTQNIQLENGSLIPRRLIKNECELKPAQYSKIVASMSKKYGVDWKLVAAVMKAESGFDPCATSPVGAMGLMQLMPSTAEMYDVKAEQLYDPETNIRAGVRHLKMLTGKFKGNLKLTVAAYNAGQGAVDRYKGIPPYEETQNYVKRVLEYRSDMKLASVGTGKMPIHIR
jgi:hypothetical protein